MKFYTLPAEDEIIKIIQQASESLNVQAYLVGGFVRDRLLGRICKDIDIVCLGNGIQLAEMVSSLIKNHPKVTVYHRFGTAMLRYNDLELEFVGARKESYSEDSRKPFVESGSLEEDQYRRDFTINALAVSLQKDDYGLL
ncbi:MAG: tRNA nucleotidyltransferase, partial [Saprospiraceae bacterium]|nr:tRNA nucleotidyltransferase [Saprospiraceae bacterium]